MSMPREKTQRLFVHGFCILVIALVFVLSATLFSDNAAVSAVLVGAGTWLYGKLCFKPAEPVLERIVTNMPTEEFTQMVSKRPPPSTSSAPAAPIEFTE